MLESLVVSKNIHEEKKRGRFNDYSWFIIFIGEFKEKKIIIFLFWAESICSSALSHYGSCYLTSHDSKIYVIYLKWGFHWNWTLLSFMSAHLRFFPKQSLRYSITLSQPNCKATSPSHSYWQIDHQYLWCIGMESITYKLLTFLACLRRWKILYCIISLSTLREWKSFYSPDLQAWLKAK